MQLPGSLRGDLAAPFGGALGSGLRPLRFAPSFARTAPQSARPLAPLLGRPTK